MSDVLPTCQETRGMMTIEEIDCPKCGGVIEVFIRDGRLWEKALRSVRFCNTGDVHLSLYLEEDGKVKIPVCERVEA